jgi:hypothetical protein
MRQPKPRQVRVKAFTPTLDEDEFHALCDLLYELLKKKDSACARVLGVHRNTWKKWNTHPPDFPWWNLILRHLIKLYIAGSISRGGLTGSHLRAIRDRLSQVPNSTELEEEAVSLAYNLTGAQTHLRELLKKKGMFWDQIRLAAHCGGYSQKTLKQAARSLEVVKTQEGFGKNKRSYWRLRNEDD